MVRAYNGNFGHGFAEQVAEQVLVPTENAFPLGSVEEATAAQWAALNVCPVPYGGLLVADLKVGDTVLVTGATGNFGSAGVPLALAMGAGCTGSTLLRCLLPIRRGSLSPRDAEPPHNSLERFRLHSSHAGRHLIPYQARVYNSPRTDVGDRGDLVWRGEPRRDLRCLAHQEPKLNSRD